MTSDYIDIVFDGPPSHESGRFVEVENAAGHSINAGEWLQRPDGYWALRLRRPSPPQDGKGGLDVASRPAVALAADPGKGNMERKQSMPDDEITDAQRWQFQIESKRNIMGAIHMLQLLFADKGTKESYITMTDRVIRSARADGHTKV